MKNEIRSLLDAVFQSDGTQSEFVKGDYSMTFEDGAIIMSISGKPVAKYILKGSQLVTLDWDRIRENRYMAYRLEQLGYPVHADGCL